MNEDLASIYNVLARVKSLRSLLSLRERVESEDTPFIVTKSIADYQDGYFTEMKGIHVDYVKRETEHMRSELHELEIKLRKVGEML